MKGDGLWESMIVPGWRAMDEYLEPASDRDVDWCKAERDTWDRIEVGCSCGWEGLRQELQPIGIDGQPLQAVHQDQMELV